LAPQSRLDRALPVGVHGPQDLSTDEAAAIIASATGKPVQCIDATLDQARGALAGMGMPDFVVDLIIEQLRRVPRRPPGSGEPRTPDTTTPTTLAEFVRTTTPASDPQRVLSGCSFVTRIFSEGISQ